MGAIPFVSGNTDQLGAFIYLFILIYLFIYRVRKLCCHTVCHTFSNLIQRPEIEDRMYGHESLDQPVIFVNWIQVSKSVQYQRPRRVIKL